MPATEFADDALSLISHPIWGKNLMLEPPKIRQAPASLTAVIHLTIPRSAIRHVMGPALGELMAALTAPVIAPAGSWFSHHPRMHPDTFDFEVGVPVPSPVVAVGRVRPGQRLASTVARTIYQGDYEGLGAAWGEFDAWIASQGHAPEIDLWETDLLGPESTSNPADWRTQLERPLST